MAGDEKNLVGLWFGGQKYAPYFFKDCSDGESPSFFLTRKWLDIYFSGKAPDFTPPIGFLKATPFQRLVWDILLEIPFGKTVTYGYIAKRIEEITKKRASAQAVGGAVGRNPVSIIVPCHRVIGANGSLTGYAGGLENKRFLLKNERVKIL